MTKSKHIRFIPHGRHVRFCSRAPLVCSVLSYPGLIFTLFPDVDSDSEGRKKKDSITISRYLCSHSVLLPLLLCRAILSD